MTYTFSPKPSKFEGWGIFQPVDEKTAKVVEEADLLAANWGISATLSPSTTAVSTLTALNWAVFSLWHLFWDDTPINVFTAGFCLWQIQDFT